MAIAVRVPRHRGARQRQRAGDRSGQGGGRRGGLATRVMDLAKTRSVSPRDIITRSGVRERDRRRWRRPADRPTRCCICWRSRSEAGVELALGRLRSHQRADAALRGPEAVGPLRGHRPARGRRQPAGRPAPVDAKAARRVARRSRARRSARKPRRRRGDAGQEVVRPVDNPIKPHRRPGDPLRQPRARRRGVEGVGHRAREHRGPARVFDSEEAAFDAVQRQSIEPGDVVVIRYEGPERRARACARCWR